jgi:nicotinamide mononucleotide transporter
MNTLEIIVNVLLTIRQNVWCWPVGAISVVFYAIVFLNQKLYADMTLQAVYFLLQFYGWYKWLHGGMGQSVLPVSRASKKLLINLTCIGSLATLGIGMLLQILTDAALPYWDAGVTSFSIVAVWMMARKLLENWVLWMILNIVYIGIFFDRSMYPSLALYALLLLMAAVGYRDWLKEVRKREVDPPFFRPQ